MGKRCVIQNHTLGGWTSHGPVGLGSGNTTGTALWHKIEHLWPHGKILPHFCLQGGQAPKWHLCKFSLVWSQVNGSLKRNNIEKLSQDTFIIDLVKK